MSDTNCSAAISVTGLTASRNFSFLRQNRHGSGLFQAAFRPESHFQSTRQKGASMAIRRDKKTPWETDLMHTTVHELGHATMIEMLGMEWRRCVVEVNPDHVPGKHYWIGHTTNRHGDQETLEEAILIDIAGVLAQALYEVPRLTAFRAMWCLHDNRHMSECNGAWTDAHVKKALRLLRAVWPSLLAEAETWSAEQLINHPAPSSISLVDGAKTARAALGEQA